MHDFFTWMERTGAAAEPWLILGKGPSLSKLEQFDTKPFRRFALNHVVRDIPVDLAHCIDIDVIDACAATLADNCRALVMPWHPHRNQRYHPKTLAEWADEIPLLGRLREEGRLLWYNLIGTGAKPHAGSPAVEVKYFSGEAAVNLLATAGVRMARSLGVDGGASYAERFTDLNGTTLLANGRSDFDRQFARIAGILLRTGMDFAPLDVESPIRVYVACSESELLPTKLLEYSLRKHTSMTVQVEPMWMHASRIPTPHDRRNHPRTPFSFQRFLIPELAGRRGHAVYLDADMQVFDDFKALWTHPMGNSDLLAVQEPARSGRKPQFSVMLLDCERLTWDIDTIVAALDAGTFTYEQLMQDMAAGGIVGRTLPERWNHLERYVEDVTGLLHYTDMETQPWIHAHHRLGYLWCRDLLEAVASGHIPLALIEEHVARGWIRPSLLRQIREGVPDPLLLSTRVLAADDTAFRAPYQQLGLNQIRFTTRLKAQVRHWYHGSLAQRVVRRLRSGR